MYPTVSENVQNQAEIYSVPASALKITGEQHWGANVDKEHTKSMVNRQNPESTHFLNIQSIRNSKKQKNIQAYRVQNIKNT